MNKLEPIKTPMQIRKRNGKLENVSFDKILKRISNLATGDTRFTALKQVDPTRVAQKVIENIFDGVETHVLDDYASEFCLDLSLEEPEYSELATRITISNIHKGTSAKTFSIMSNDLHAAGVVNTEYNRFVQKEKEVLNICCKSFRDYHIDSFGYKTLAKSYLYKGKKYTETPQHLFLRVAVGLWYNAEMDQTSKLKNICATYDYISQKQFIHASPTLFNAGTDKSQMSSCFVVGTGDSIEEIFKTVADLAKISKWAGGIGLHISNIRARGSLIRGTKGKSLGIMPMMKLYDNLCSYINQGGKRNGSIAIYLEPHHADVFEFLKMKNNTTDIEHACRNLFSALWTSDYFMKCVKENTDWYLMCPDTCKGLTDVYGEEYTKLYQKYVSKGMYVRVVKARDIWNEFLRAQSLAGMPYLLFKDAINEKSNQKNIGVIKSSNLCAEITLVSDNNNYSVCNLASVCLTSFVKPEGFDFASLTSAVKQIVRNLNRVIDINYYPTPETHKTNDENRPIGIGVQGLANVFYSMKIPFDSNSAKVLNKQIFETISFAAWSESCEIAKECGPYKFFQGSPISQGKFQHDLWGINESTLICNWNDLRSKIRQYGVRNSVVTCCMPTASTSQIMGNYESFEPITSNMFTRNTLSGNHIVINKYLVNDLKELGLWNTRTSSLLQKHSGSIQNISSIPESIKNLYKTIWEIKQKVLIDLAIDRAPFIDQTQSMNLYLENPTVATLTSMYFYCWEKGLKTGCYYLRSKSSSKAVQFTVDCESCSA